MRLNGRQTIYQMIQLAEEVRAARRHAARAAGVQAPLPRPADAAHPAAGSTALAAGPGDAGGVDRARQPRPAGRACAARGADALPGQRHRPEVRPPRGRAAGPGAVLRRAHLRGAGRLPELLQEDGHRAHPAARTACAARSCSASATASSRSRRSSGSAAWRWRWPATRCTARGVNAWKRDRLVQAGRDVVIPEYREHEALLRFLFDVGDG